MPETVVKRERKLPLQQLLILAICRFAEPIASTSIFPYLPEMVESFGVAQDDVGKWAGICSSMFSICQAITGIPWGRFSDLYGRKIAILLGLCTTLITSLLWGFSTNLPMAITARGLAGAGNGNVGILRTTVAEMVPFKELQPRAFSFMPLVWNLGSVFGPMIGGALANPYNVKPLEHFDHPNLLQRFPYVLPNLVSAIMFFIGITTGTLFLKETLASRKDRRDYGIVLGRKIVKTTKKAIRKVADPLSIRTKSDTPNPGEQEPLLGGVQDEETTVKEPLAKPIAAPSYSEVLNKQAILNLIVYTFIALHTMSYDQLLPVFMHHPPLWDKHSSRDPSNPLKFAAGLGLDHFRIGMITTVYGICGMLTQFLLFPPVARRFGVLRCLKACVIAFPVIYLITPFTALFPSTSSQIAAVFGVMVIRCFAAIFAFPSSTILLTNSATSLRTLGTLNGIATSAGAIGRAVGPAMGGAMFTLGVKRGYVIAPWWLFCAIAIVGAIPAWYLVEGEGFGGDDEGHVSDDEEEDEELLHEAGLEGGEDASGKPGPTLVPNGEPAERHEAANGRIDSMSRTTTVSSSMSLGSALSVNDEEDEDDLTVRGSVPTGSEGQAQNERRSTRVVRRMSIPIGTGREGISRRYSSNLGHSFGSAGSYHGH